MEIKIKNHDLYMYDGKQMMGYIQCHEVQKGVIDAQHTVVQPEYQGQGLAKKLFLALVEHAREQHLQIIPSCSYIEHQFEKSNQYHDIDYRAK